MKNKNKILLEVMTTQTFDHQPPKSDNWLYLVNGFNVWVNHIGLNDTSTNI